MSLFGIVFLAWLIVAVTTDQTLWDELQQNYEKNYLNAADDWAHMKVTLENMRRVVEQNASFKTGKISYELDINEFSVVNDIETGFGSHESNTLPKKRTKRNNFGDLPVKCGPDQEKIDGECHYV